jgi:uncharacterized membrane protein YgcG
MVEFLVWLLQEYYENMNKDKKQVFAQVHFCLFYTAIFNSVQSVILYHVVRRLSKRIWITTEALELAHYVEIREEFDAISQQLQQQRRQGHQQEQASNNQNNTKNASPGNNKRPTLERRNSVFSPDTQLDLQEAEFAFEYNWTGVQFLWQSACDSLSHPRHLKRRYHDLLLQVRFHELRVHFVEAYRLPSNFRISTYLVRSEEQVLMKLLNVTTYAWLFLTASANLLYYILGIGVTETGDLQLPGYVMIYIYYISMTCFLLVAFALYNKMKVVFKNIMHRNHLWQNITLETTARASEQKRIDNSDEDKYHDVDEPEQEEKFSHVDSYSSKKEALEAEQLSLFWASSPKLVITAIQVIQFGYALALSVIIIFWTEINDANVHMAWYLLAIAVCYGLFVLICAQTVPRYTLCTSLGQLVDKKRLQEALALHRLDEARKSAREAGIFSHSHRHDYDDDKPQPPTLALHAEIGSPGMNDDDDPLSQSAHGLNGDDDHEVPSSAFLKSSPRSRQGVVGDSNRVYCGQRPNTATRESTRRTTQHSMAAGDLALSGRTIATSSSGGGGSVGGRSTGSGSESIAMLVKMDTHTLRSLLPRDELEKLSLRDEKRRAKSKGGGAAGTTRSCRQKAMSYGVAAMAGMREEPDVAAAEWPQQKQSIQPQPAPEITSNDEDNDEASDRLSPLDTTPANLRARRRRSTRRRKSVSDGVALMAAISVPYDHGNSRCDDEESAMDPPVPLTISSTTPLTVHSSDGASIAKVAARERSEEPQPVAATRESSSNERVQYSDDHDVPEYANYLHKNDKHDPLPGDDSHGMNTGEIVEYKRPQAPKLSFLERCCLYYKSKKYIVVSNVFGTVPAFFWCATRVERFLHTENIIPSGMFVSFQFDQRPSFWLLSSWMYMFILSDSLLILSLPGYTSLRRFRDRCVWVSALIDMAIVYACVMVFNMAEVERCCYPTDDESELDAAYDLGSGVKSVYQKADAYDTAEAYAAKDDAYGEKSYTIGVDPHPCDCPAFGSRLYGGLGHLEPYTSLIALRLLRFWAAGVFVRFLDGHQGKVKSKTERMQDDKDRKRLNPMDVHDDEHGHGDDSHHHHQESGTAAELWEAAVAGHPELVAKYGEFSREVLLAMLNIPIVEEEKAKHERDLSLTRISSSSLETENNNNNDKKSVVKATTSATSMMVIAKQDPLAESSSLFFKSDDSKLAYANFQEPDAPLVLSMHRCERKLLPILETWCTVDVVMTPYEMVYFDVSSSGDNDKDKRSNSVVEGAIRQALMATKGGKGLSLCAVASIRRVVGHVLFSDVTGVAVDKSRAASMAPMQQQQTVAGVVASECIQIQTSNGHTLCLKFYCNSLVEHRDNNGSLDQWVQMIRRYCGLELSPSLNVTAYPPDDDDDESFVEV